MKRVARDGEPKRARGAGAKTEQGMEALSCQSRLAST